MVVGVVAVVGLLTYGLVSKGSGGVAIGDPAPATALPRLEGGGSESIRDYRGQWVLVNFWASWCDPCRDEAPELVEFQRQHGGEGFTVLGVASRDLSSDSIRFAAEYGMGYPQMRDGDGKFAGEFGTTGVPENYLIDPQGKVRLLVRGPITGEWLENEVAPLLDGARS